MAAATRLRSTEVPLKRQWDAELEAELEAALPDLTPRRSMWAGIGRGKPNGRSGIRPRPGPGSPQEDLRTGKVIAMRGKSLFVDLGGKSEGVIPLGLFEGEIPAPGSQIEVVVDHFDVSEGIQHLRLKGAAIDANWENLRKGVIVEARGTKVVKGGLEVDVDGIRGFIPISQIDLSRVEDAATFVNQKFKALVTEVNSAREEPGDLPPRVHGTGAGRSSARRPGPRSKSGRFARGPSVRSRISVRSLIWAASTASCPSAR